MSTVAEISEAIEKLGVKEQIELLEILPEHLKISPDDLAWPRLADRPLNSGTIPRIPSTTNYKRGDIVGHFVIK